MAGTPASSRGGGGAGPSVVLQAANVDLAAIAAGSGVYLIPWNAAFDNTYDYNVLATLPAGLGLTFAIDGSSADITTLEAGIWTFELAIVIPADLTAAVALDYAGADLVSANVGPGIVTNGDKIPVYLETLTLPAAAVTRGRIQVPTAPTAGVYNTTAIVGLVTRLA